MFVVVFRDEFSTFCQSFIVIVVQEGVTVCNPKTDSNSEFGCPNTAEERERLLGQKPSKGWPRVDHVCHTGTGQSPPKKLDNFAPPSILFKSLQFPPFSFKKKKCEIPSMIFSQFFSTSKHHNFLIRSRN